VRGEFGIRGKSWGYFRHVVLGHHWYITGKRGGINKRERLWRSAVIMKRKGVKATLNMERGGKEKKNQKVKKK